MAKKKKKPKCDPPVKPIVEKNSIPPVPKDPPGGTNP